MRERDQRRKDFLERYERDVHDDDVRFFADEGGVERAGIDLLEGGHARILTDLPVELVLPDVDRENLAYPPQEKHVRDPAGGCADVDGEAPFDSDPEPVEGRGKLDSPARHVGVVLAADANRRVAVDR